MIVQRGTTNGKEVRIESKRLQKTGKTKEATQQVKNLALHTAWDKVQDFIKNIKGISIMELPCIGWVLNIGVRCNVMKFDMTRKAELE